MEMDTTAAATVQHVTKKSSDELLRKFAEVDDDGGAKKELKRRKWRRSSTRWNELMSDSCNQTPSHYYAALVEKRALLSPAVTRKSLLLRQLGIGRSQLKARDINNKSILATIEKTWRKTLEGASKVLLEKHYNRHRRLINDVV